MHKTCGVFKLTPTDFLNSGRAYVSNESISLSKCPDPEATCKFNMRFRRLKELNETELMKELEIDPDLSNCQEFDFTLLKSLNATNEQTLDISAMNNVNHGGYGNILPRTITNMTNFYSEVPPRSKSFATNEDIKQNLTPSHIQNLDLIYNRSNSRP